MSVISAVNFGWWWMLITDNTLLSVLSHSNRNYILDQGTNEEVVVI